MTIYFTSDDDPAQLEPFMRCGACNENLCTVEEGDTLNVLNALADEHARECAGSPGEVTR
jgi:uncharacterized protein with PIN domain